MGNNDVCARSASSGDVRLGSLPGFIGFVLRRAQYVMYNDFVKTLEPLDLRPAYFYVLVVIDENPGLNQSEVSAALGIQRTNFVLMVDQLEKCGLIDRRPAKNDRRCYALHLTDRGRTVLQMASALQAEHEERFSRKLGAGGREQLLPLLWKIVN